MNQQKKKAAFTLTLGLALAAVLAMAGVAIATHVHPANLGAKKLSFTLVPAFKACTTGTTGTHGSPLAAPSCKTTSASAESATLTTGVSPSGLFKGTGFFSVEVYCTDGSAPPCPATGDQEELKLIGSLTDVRCKASIASDATLCPSTNSAGGKDYAGQVQANPTIRITDHYNTVTTSPTPACSSTTSCSATVVDLPFPVTGTCAATPSDATIGGACNFTTGTGVCPPQCGQVIPEGKKMNVEFGQIVVNDGGTDGLASTSGNTVFERQGIYIP
jgi:hypothetical protein